MALHNIVFVVDVDHGGHDSDDQLDVRNHFVKRGILQILLHFSCKYGFDKVRWGYKFFHFRTGLNPRFISRGSDFRELRLKTFEDFEIEFEAKCDAKNKPGLSHRKQKSDQSASVQNALKEALLDFQWDRPDITSPTKLSLRPRRSSRTGTQSVPQEDEGSSAVKNVVFVVSECPRSRKLFMEYLSLGSQDLSADPSEHILSRGLHDMLVQRRVALHWIDSRSQDQIVGCEDHFGFDRLSEVLDQLDGSVIPLVALLNLCQTQEIFPLKSSIGYLLSSERLYRLAFPVISGVLQWEQGGVHQCCDIQVEPLCRRQELLSESVSVCLTAVLQGWDSSSLTQTISESWVLQCCSSQGAEAFQHLLTVLSARGLHMLSEVNDGGLVCSAILSPLSPSTAVLTVLQPQITQHNQFAAIETSVATTTKECSADLPDVVNSVLGVVYNIMEEDSDIVDEQPKDHPVPEWAQQEVILHPLTSGVLESWFPQSDQSGVSSHLMESMKLLHAVPEEQEDESSVLYHELISGLADVYQTSQSTGDKRAKKRQAQCTPVKQKMKSMSRSLQMLNVARLNVKAQKNQPEAEKPVEPERPGKRRSADRSKPDRACASNFSSEAKLLSHLKSSYNRTVSERELTVLCAVQQLLSAVKTFFSAESDMLVKITEFVQQHLLKTSKNIRQLYSSAADADDKVRECQLQALLRLELCQLNSPQLDVDQIAEEVADMLRVISLTKDPVCLTRFLQDDVLPRFLTVIPRVLADVYHSLGTPLPEALLAVLPADFFSDESIAKDSVSPSASSPPLSARSPASEGGNLQNLRDRSANQRRSGVLTRHRSMTEASQSLRQIEMPKKTTRASKSKTCAAMEKTVAETQPEKQEKQEVTKVRRNLFNQEIVSPSKKAKVPRSQSVSAVEGLKRKRCDDSEEGYKLLTKRVRETPHHKQVSSRLLYRQKMGRTSAPTEECIVEESPVKPAEDLRRSPRIKKFARRHSSTFYSSSQPRSRNLDRALSASQLSVSEVNIKTVSSPMRLLFGAASSPGRPSNLTRVGRCTRSQLSTDSSVFESPNKTPTKSPGRSGQNYHGITTPKTPRTSQNPRTPKTTPPSRFSSVAESPAAGSSSEFHMALRRSPFRSPVTNSTAVETPTKQTPMKGILRTPVKSSVDGPSSSGLYLLHSPLSRTPKKSVTWSPSPRKCRVTESNVAFKVPESPHTPSRTSQRLSKSVNTMCSPIKSTNTNRDIFKTHGKNNKQSPAKISKSASNPRSSEDSSHLKTPEKNIKLQETTPPESTAPQKYHTSSAPRTPSPNHHMITRSGRTPGKNEVSPLKPASTPGGTSPCSVMSPTRLLTRRRSDQGVRTRRNLRSQSSENLIPRSAESYSKDIEEEPSQTSEVDSGSQTDSHQFDSSHLNSASTDDESVDIVDAAVTKTQFTGGLKMNISFARKPSQFSEEFVSSVVSANPPEPARGTPGRSYGFRQTPDRQQREAAARLGYGNVPPRFSTPRGSAGPRRQTESPNFLTYQVEMEMQTSGLPKLKIKRTDSMNAGDSAVVLRPSQQESPKALSSKQREPGCVSPSVCAHLTPAKSTPGKGVQTFICQSYTPTRHPRGTVSPVAIPEIIPMTPSPQSVGKMAPDNLNSWPRRKRAQTVVLGVKDRGLKAEPVLVESLEEAELGVRRLQDIEEMEVLEDKTASKRLSSHRADASPSPTEDFYWMEKLAQQADCSEPHTAGEEVIRNVNSLATPPGSKMRKPVTASGILALTHSPLLFMGKTGSAQKKTPCLLDEAGSGRRRRRRRRTEDEAVELSPFSLQSQSSNSRKSYSRKRLLP